MFGLEIFEDVTKLGFATQGPQRQAGVAIFVGQKVDALSQFTYDCGGLGPFPLTSHMPEAIIDEVFFGVESVANVVKSLVTLCFA